MIRALGCSKCGISQADKPLIALPMMCICHDCYKQQKSLEDRCDKLEDALKLTIDRWRLIGRKIWDTKVRVSILELQRQLEKDVEQILKG